MTNFGEQTGTHSRSPEDSKRLSRRLVTAGILAVCAVNLCGGATTVAKQGPECNAENDSNNSVASATYNPEGDHASVEGDIPASYSDAYTTFIPDAVNDPIVQLAFQTGDVTSVVARVSPPKGNPLLSRGPVESGRYDNNAQCDTEKEVALDFSTIQAKGHEANLFADQFYTHITVVHEAIHGLNDDWWMKIGETQAFDRTMEPRIYQLQSTCDDINKWITYKNVGKMPRSMEYSDDASVGVVCSTEIMTLSTQALQDAFRCVNEGKMLQDMRGLKNSINLGHPWSNATELASSVTDVLLFNPEYLERCFADQDKMEATLIKKYAKATLELSFIHRPELEQILRQNQKTSEALDFLMAAT